MSINENTQTEYSKAKNYIKNSYISALSKGAVIPTKRNLENLPDCIGSIESQQGAMLMSLLIEEEPVKTSYIEGEPILLTGMSVKAIYDNDAEKDITDCCNCTPCANELVKLTDTCITIDYEEDGKHLSISEPITVAEYVPILQSIEVTKPPKKNIYLTGNTLDTSGMVVTATYGRGEKVDVTADSTFNPTNHSILSVADNKIVISYTENGITKTTQIAISVENSSRTLVSLEVTTPPTKLSYYTSEYFDPTGMIAIATFMGGATEDVTDYCSFSPSYFENDDTESVTVSYSENDITESDDVAVSITESVITGIEIITNPNTNYFVGQTFDTSGMVVKANYNSGKSVDITSSCTISNESALQISDTSITISYLTFSTTIAITVSNVEMISIEVTTPPTKTVYYEGETLDTSGMVITANFNNGATMILNSGYTTNPTILNAEDTFFTVAYQELSTQQNITVIEPVINSIAITTPPTKTNYVINELIDITGIVVTATYTNGNTEIITNQCTFTPGNALTVDDTNIVAHYLDLTASTSITVLNFVPVSIEIIQNPTKLNYLAGNNLDLTGLIVKITYNDGSTTQLTNGTGLTVTPSTSLAAANTSVSVAYTLNLTTVTATFNISVIEADSTFGNNTWEKISQISDMGIANSIWNVGDTKTETINGTTYTFRIIGFDHDDLVTPLANGRTKAGITLESTTGYSSVRLSTRNDLSNWANSTPYVSTLPSIYENTPANLKNYIKSVNKVHGTETGLATLQYHYFVLAVREIFTTTPSNCILLKEGEGTIYPYYNAGNTYKKAQNYWTRTLLKDAYNCMWVSLNSNGEIYTGSSNNYNYIVPVFCI